METIKIDNKKKNNIIINCIIGVVLFILILTNINNPLNAQVKTRFFKDNSDIYKFITDYPEGKSNLIKLPKPDVWKVLEQDKKRNVSVERYAIELPVNISEKDGEYHKTRGTIKWYITFYADEATSLSYKFSNVILPENSKMYIFSKDKKVIVGPITNANIIDGKYSTDVVFGNTSTIEVIMPDNSSGNDFKINIDYVYYGIIQNLYDLVEYSISGDCNVDVNSQEQWYDVKKGVALILIDDKWLCSGSLVTDECNSGTPYFLTANHCLTNENNVNDWKFKFGYESGASETFTVKGAEIRARDTNTDFLLLELTGEGSNSFDDSYFNSINHDDYFDGEFACIHHPMGQLKKIAIAKNQLYIDNSNYVKIKKWNKGILDQGSSGSPLFDSNHKIIGQLQRGVGECNPNTGGTYEGEKPYNTFGKTSISWLGGGTDNSSLQSWLGAKLDVIIEGINPTCNMFNGSATAYPSCGIEPYSYLWSNGETTKTITDLAAGTYTVTVTDAEGNTGEGSVVIEPEIIVDANTTLWSDVIAQYNLDPNELINRNIYVENYLKVDVNYTFSNVMFNFTRSQDLYHQHWMIIEENTSVLVRGVNEGESILKSCNGEWGGVSVGHYSNFTIKNSIIQDVYRGIYSLRYGDINVENVEIIGTYIHNSIENGGIMMFGKANRQISNVIISNFYIGILGASNAIYTYFDSGSIDNCFLGFYLLASPAFISEFDIDSEYAAVELKQSPGSVVSLCNFNSGDFGIGAIKSPGLSIYKNTGNNTLKTFAYLYDCSYSELINNWDIRASQYGIKTFSSNDLTITGNDFNINGNLSAYSGALQLNDSKGSFIDNNNISIDGLSFGIESNVGLENIFTNNSISYTSAVFIPYLTRLATVKSMGSDKEEFKYNTISGVPFAEGMTAQNSNVNSYLCNDVSGSAKDGLYVGANSEYQFIKGNKFLDCTTDLRIRSLVGQQYYTGNEFYNGFAYATTLNLNELENSIFYVNSNIAHHMPDHPHPDNGKWFIDDPDHTGPYSCGGEGGPKDTTVFDDELALIQYFDDIKQKQISDPERFFVKAYHLLEYAANNEDYTLPISISSDPAIINTCGLTQLVDVIAQISRLSDLSGQSSLTLDDLENIRILQNQYMNANDDEEKETILNNLNELMIVLEPGFKEEHLQDSLSAENLKLELDAIDCTNDLVQKWKSTYISYIDFIQTGEITTENQNTLKEISTLCSDLYGDAIHLARALTNTFDSTYYDVNDDCLSEPVYPRIELENTLNAIIQPNPSKGEILVNMDKAMSGIIEVFDMSGKLLFSDNISNSSQYTLNIEAGEGMYLVKILSDSGEKFIEKIVVIK